MSAQTTHSAEDLVPLAERSRWMRIFRLVAVVAVMGTAVTLPELQRGSLHGLAVVAAAYLAVALGGDAVRELSRRRGLSLFGLLLVVDGVFLAYAAYAIALPASPARFLIVVHIVTVTLLASFRTGLKIALWHSLLLFTVFYAREAGHLGEPVTLGDVEYRTLVVSVAFYLTIALATAAFAAVNERELRRRRYDLEELARLANRLEHADDAGDVARGVIEAVRDTFGFERVLLITAPRGEFVLLDHHGAAGGVPRKTQRVGRLLSEAMAAHEPLLVSRFAAHDDPWLAALLPEHRNLALVALQADGGAVGVMVCEHGMRAGSRIERRVVTMLERFCSHSALALRNAWLVDQLTRSAMTDGLTGLANRRSFDKVLGQELARARRDGETFSLILADIDRFKHLNDTHGHLTGDAVLRVVAETLAEAARAGDHVARYGGEEFAVVLAGADEETALTAAERLRVAVAGSPTEVPVTVSLGVATFPDDAGDSENLISRADGALYASKRQGRDRVTSARTAEGVPVPPTGR